MLIGRTGCGKTTLCQVLHNENIRYKKTQAVDFYQNIIDTPGEYIENRVYYKALIVSSADCDVLALLQDCNDEESIFPPNFCSIFAKPVIGIITKIDICKNQDNINRAQEFLESAGVHKIFQISSSNNTGLEELKNYL